MRNFARKLCRNQDEAEDIAQEAFLKAYMAFDQCEDKDHLDNWLMRIVYHTFLDFKRKENRRIKEFQASFVNEEYSIDNEPDPSSSPEEILIGQTISPEFVEVFNKLDRQSRELFQLAYVEGLDHIEIGRRFGIKPGCSRSRAHRLCTQVRRMIAKKLASAGNESLSV